MTTTDALETAIRQHLDDYLHMPDDGGPFRDDTAHNMAASLREHVEARTPEDLRPAVYARVEDWIRDGHADWTHITSNSGEVESVVPDMLFDVWFAGEQTPRRWQVYAVGIVSLATEDADHGRKRPSIAIDAGAAHHNLVSNWAKLPKHPLDVRELDLDGCRLELLQRGQVVQLSLKLENATPTEIVMKTLRGMVGARGQRHWTAYLKQLSVEGNRQGHVRWTVDGHLNTMNLPASKARDPVTRRQTIDLVNMFTSLELAVINKDGSTRSRRPLVTVWEREEKRTDNDGWELDGMTLQINPLLYTGVRKEDGKPGRNYWPQSPQLPHINHKRYPYAHGLGTILPARWRREAAKGNDHVRISGKKLIETAGIRYSDHNPARAWRSLNRMLKVLQKYGCLSRIVVEGTPETPSAIYCLYPPTWQSDRILRKLRVVEDWRESLPLTGAELRTWREEKGWTQAELAERAGVTRRTVANNEAGGEKRLSKQLRSKLEAM